MSQQQQHKRLVVTLYRQCMKSVKRIPDADQRSMYYFYVRDGFQKRKQMPHSSMTTTRVIEDTKEQVERMNYYHSIREKKKRTNQQSSNVTISMEPIINDSKNESTTAMTMKKKRTIVTSWLLEQVPHLHNDDVENYTTNLIQDGFDSLYMLENELLESDLQHFMKKAHQRVLIKKINNNEHTGTKKS